MRKWQYPRLVFLLCLVSLLLAGCQFKDVDRRAFVLSFGIDSVQTEEAGGEGGEGKEGEGKGKGKGKHLIEVSLKLAIPEGDPTKRNQEAIVISQISSSIPEAIRLLKSKVDKELDFSLCKTLLFGEGYARNNISEMTDWMVRRRDIQLVAYNGVARPTAKEVLGVRLKSERVPAYYLILSLGKEGTESPFIVSTFSYNLRRHLTEQGLDPVLPLVEKEGEDTLLINKAVLLDNQRIRAELTPDEARLLNLLTQRGLRTSFNVEMDGNIYSYNMETNRSKFKLAKSNKGNMVVQYTVGGRASLEDNTGGIEMTGPILRAVSKAASEQWEKEIKQFLVKIHGTGLDPFGWGLRYSAMNWNNATELEEWRRIYPNLEFSVKADVQVRYSGMIR
ncbi:Ger(x)C family spore germination C-terminal domain-containing protein [Paenibacillus woosongensis]|uniref:Ger(X)C family spore germination C-terminal domain-containing protein n=1 Tax=Paenibacillus woosongensis TaxID=307580 RepID=A0AA95I6F5_9BACL|nr:Ger(x)C family spore germination C-terminal domain-containing protein [Paenibacillus woosongensis]WHX48253.1 Ger(x)C family spore germination C-terminal domain-containing protein [Paenibacillus woosongensis]